MLGRGIQYQVEVEGADTLDTYKKIKRSTRLYQLRKKRPSSINALRYRASSDIPDIRKILRSKGYYEPKITVDIDDWEESALVSIYIDTGPRYILDDISIEVKGRSELIPAGEIDLDIGLPAISSRIIRARETLIKRFTTSGYPFAKIEDRDIRVDGKTKSVSMQVLLDPGPISYFGDTTVNGLHNVDIKLIERHLKWEDGELYDSESVATTQKKLLDLGVFSSVFVNHAEMPESSGILPMEIEVAEQKHRTINFGASFQTFFGPGLNFGWEHRNISGMGRKFTLRGEFTQRSHVGIATLLIPDFQVIGQNYTIQAEAAHEDLFAYNLISYSLLNRFDKRIRDKIEFSVGVKLERLHMGESEKDGIFHLIETPLYFRIGNIKNLLDPLSGDVFELRTIPSVVFEPAKTPYLTMLCTWSSYKRMFWSDLFVFAQRITLGSILSESLNSIPISKRFLGGSEEELRGYRYKTVAPLEDGKPIGGRSCIYYTAELRVRLSEKIGIVPFFDLGNVAGDVVPMFRGKWLKSVGGGLRYFSFMGPLRFDVGFPLDKRPFDPKYRIFVSIGQTF